MANEMGYEGSGARAMESNKAALAAAEQEMESLRQRAASGEIVDKEVRQVADKIRRFKEDQGRIESAGMV